LATTTDVEVLAATEAADLEALEAEATEAADLGAAEEAEVSIETSAQEKCTRQLAQTASRNAKFLSSQPKADLFIARTATQNTRKKSKSFF
jgi:hypothetical protein